MTLETFFENFNLFTDAPDAVGKMRELVRHLAVKGKLVAQDFRDEPAEKLISRVLAALPNKKSENPFLQEVEPTITAESEYELPQGWAWLPLGHIGIWATGCGFPTQYQGEADKEFLFCKVSDMNLPGNEVEILRTVHTIDADVMKKIRARVNPTGTVIFPKIGGSIATHKRRLVIKPTIIDNNCSGILPIGLTDNCWLLLYMRSLDLTRYQSGTSVPAVSQGSLDPIRVGLPPLAEQKRIVAKVDELMALCDRLETQQQEREAQHTMLARASLARFADAPTPANLDFILHKSYAISPADLRKSILELAFCGRLTRQDFSDGEPETLPLGDENRRWEIERIILPDMGQSPDSWKVLKIGELITELIGGVSTSKSDYVDDGILVFNKGNVQSLGRTGFGHDCNFVSKAFFDLHADRAVQPGDMVVALRDFSVKADFLGLIGEYTLESPALLSQGACIVRIFPGLLGRYLMLFSNSSFYRKAVKANKIGTTQVHLRNGQFGGIPIPLPPLAEQHRIVAKVDQLMALVDVLETQLADSRAAATNLLSALVAELTGTASGPQVSAQATSGTGRRGRPRKMA